MSRKPDIIIEYDSVSDSTGKDIEIVDNVKKLDLRSKKTSKEITTLLKSIREQLDS